MRVEGKHDQSYAADADTTIAIMAHVTVALDRTREATQPDGFVRYARSHSCGISQGRDHMLKRVKFVGIPVRDQEKALVFWTKTFGLQVATDQPMGKGQRWIELKIPGAQTGLALFTPPVHE